MTPARILAPRKSSARLPRPEVLLRHADQTMYEAKESGRSRICVFDADAYRQHPSRRDLVLAIAESIRSDPFVLYCPPRISLQDGRLVGAEALLRWFPDGRACPPSEVIAGIRDSDRERELDSWVIGRVLAEINTLAARGIPGTFSANVNPRTLEHPGFPAELDGLLAGAGVAGKRLELEILEVSSITSFERIDSVLRQCKESGISIALDDFGTGYSSLSHFHAPPIDVLKIDQRFVRELAADARSLALVKSILALAQANARKVVAEGIESDAVAAAMRQLDCTEGQGYAIARPMAFPDLLAWAETWAPAAFLQRTLRRRRAAIAPERASLPGRSCAQDSGAGAPCINWPCQRARM